MIAERGIRVLDLDLEIKEAQLKLSLAEIGEKENIAKHLAELRSQRRGQKFKFISFRTKMHKAAETADSRVIQGINSD